MSDPEIVLPESSLAPGTSQPVRIRVRPNDQSRKVAYVVKDEHGQEVQNEEFDLPSGVDEIAWYVEAPNDSKSKKLNLNVSVNNESQADATIDVSSSAS